MCTCWKLGRLTKTRLLIPFIPRRRWEEHGPHPFRHRSMPHPPKPWTWTKLDSWTMTHDTDTSRHTLTLTAQYQYIHPNANPHNLHVHHLGSSHQPTHIDPRVHLTLAMHILWNFEIPLLLQHQHPAYYYTFTFTHTAHKEHNSFDPECTVYPPFTPVMHLQFALHLSSTSAKNTDVIQDQQDQARVDGTLMAPFNANTPHKQKI